MIIIHNFVRFEIKLQIMNKVTKLMIAAALAVPAGAFAQNWAPVGENIRTEWAEKVSPTNALPEYPRPQMVRSDWKSINGLWDYAVVKNTEAKPSSANGQILVPFALESSLSGVGKFLEPNEVLWYSTSFSVPKEWKGKNVSLNFGAVDWQADVYVNDILIGTHTGGYTEFSFDVTPYLNAKGSQKLEVRVTDATSGQFQPRGKQVLRPEGIWYTRVSGIWQSVWIEAVADGSFASYETIADIKAKTLKVNALVNGAKAGDIVKAELLEGAVGYDTEKPSSKVLATAKAVPGAALAIEVPEVKTWSPDSPYLYGLRLSLVRAGQVIDKVEGYAAMREISVVTDESNYKRMALNGEPLFQYGPLDQGWWPDGLYTAPTDEALEFDIIKTKELGFNMIRKHIKIEPARWYYHCDRLGMLVWQDMPSVCAHHKNVWGTGYWNEGTDSQVPEQWKANYYKEWGEIIAARKGFPCIVVWVPFNEGWGQFDTEKTVAFTREQDPTRLINPASGGNFHKCGDILDHHHYPNPTMRFFDSNYVMVLGEYGGIGLPLEGHVWEIDRKWGYVQYKNADDVTRVYVEYAKQLEELVKNGYSAAVYTQTTDVEGEVNGFLTYDRKVLKMDVDKVRKANTEVIETMAGK